MNTTSASPASLLDLPPIETARCVLAALRIEDAAALQMLTDDPVITEAISFLGGRFRLADAEALIAKQVAGSDAFMGIWDRDSGRLAGMIGAHLRGTDDIEIGYWIGIGFRGRGYAGEAAAALVAMLRELFPARHIIAECRPENRASWAILARLGFVPTGADGQRPGRKRLSLPDPCG